MHIELTRESRTSPIAVCCPVGGVNRYASEERAHVDATRLPKLRLRPVCRQTQAAPRAKAAGLVCVALALGRQASVAAAKPWFRETDIATNTPSVARCGKASHKARDIGGEATAVFDVNGDRIPDIVIVNGTDYYFVALGHRNPNGSVSYPKDATPYQIGVTGDDHVAKSKALGLTDFNRDGRLDLYIGNSGDGSLDLKNPRDLANAYNPANLDTSHLCEYHGYRTYLNKRNGTFTRTSGRT
jgi:FG-GAP-like repeat